MIGANIQQIITHVKYILATDFNNNLPFVVPTILCEKIYPLKKRNIATAIYPTYLYIFKQEKTPSKVVYCEK